MTSARTPEYHSLPPSPFIRRFSQFLGEEMRSALVLDLGSGSGRNSHYMAQVGHRIVAMSNHEEELKASRDIQPDQLLGDCSYVVGDARKIPLSPVFDAVVINEVLHAMSKTPANETLATARSLVKPGGLHAVSGYILQNPVSQQHQYLEPDELRDNYESVGWQVLSYKEDMRPVTTLNSRDYINSIAEIIARKPLN